MRQLTAFAALLLCVALSEAFVILPPRSKAAIATHVTDQRLPPYKTKWYSQVLDHFNFASPQRTWQQRYLVTDTYWSKAKDAPIFFYTGNEGDIFMFYNNTGAVFEWAHKFGALVIFAEHRYYGESLPMGNDWSNSAMQYCTVEQALADYAVLLRDLKKADPLLNNSPVISFGGSYGGMLTAWFRQKYPNVVEGGLAASAPVVQFPGLTGDYVFNQIVTQDYSNANPMCSSYIRDGFKLISAVATQTGGFQKLSKVFRTCTPIASNDDVNDLIDWVTNAFTYLAMTDYPYATNFLQPLPAWPVKAACAPLVKVAPTDLLTAIYLGANVYYNTSGLLTCNTLSESSVSPSLGSAWDYQACTELTLNTAANGVTDMFPPSPFSIPALIQSCQSQFGVTPRVEWIPLWTGGWNITGASNIIFSNGLLDPWSGGGITRSLSDSLTAILIKDGAHHLDLRFSDPEDPPSVITARLQESNIIQDWLNKYYARIKNN